MNTQVNNLFKNDTIEQRSEEWYHIRHNMLTASDVSSALESNPYKTKLELLLFLLIFYPSKTTLCLAFFC